MITLTGKIHKIVELNGDQTNNAKFVWETTLVLEKNIIVELITNSAFFLAKPVKITSAVYNIVFLFRTLFLNCGREHMAVHFFDLLHILSYFVNISSYCSNLTEKK